jgi:hypothetical protein
MKRILISLFLLFIVFPFASGQTPEKKQYKAERLTVAPEIDGVLDDEGWNQGTWIDDFTQYNPHNGKMPSQRTEFKILFDEDNLYVAFKALDTSPDSITRRMTRRDNVDGDLVGIFLDSFHDLRTAFLFGVSSGGVKYDQMFTNDGLNEDSSWDPNWWVKTSINDQGWIAEMKIPFSQVRFEKNSGDTWGLDMIRLLYRKNEQSLWQHIPADAPGLVHQFGELSGLEQIKPRKILDVTPYVVGKMETFKAEEGNPFKEKGRNFKFNGGVDAKIGVTNNLTMDLTINPDFGQVEADPSEVNLTAYETFFSERRPFFVEGKNITSFSFGIGDGEEDDDNLFYSRRIGRRPQGYPDLENGMYADIPVASAILGAAKLSGKTQNGLSVGFVEALTAGEKAEIDNNGERTYETVEPLTNFLIGRVQKDFNEGKTIFGGILTSTNRNLDENLGKFMHKSAYTGGIDFTQYFKDKKWQFNLNTALSQVNGSKEAIENTQRSSARYFQRPDNDYTEFDPDRTSLLGSGGRIQFMKLDGHINLLGSLSWKTPGFELNDLGYMQTADQILGILWASYKEWEPKGIYRNYNINGSIYSVWNFGGDNVGKGIQANGNIYLKNYWNAEAGGNVNTPSLSTGILRGGPMMKTPGTLNGRIRISTDSRKKLEFNFFTNINKGFQDYSKSTYTEIGVTYKPFNFLRFSVSPGYSKSFSELQYVSQTSNNGSDRYIFASIDRKTISTSLRVNFNLTPDITLQYWGQPFIASGKYYDHKYILNPMDDNYEERFHVYSGNEITEKSDNYEIDENLDGDIDYTIGKQDFNVQEFLSNMVFRWEYSPGSTVYLVWNQTRSGYNSSGNMDYFDDMGDLFNRQLFRDDDNYVLKNVFLIKFSYRFGLK